MKQDIEITVVKRCCPRSRSRTTKIGKQGGYLRFVEALQGCLLARDRAISTMRFEEASVEESGEGCQTAGDSQLLGPGDDCKRKSGSEGNDDKKYEKNADLLEAGS